MTTSGHHDRATETPAHLGWLFGFVKPRWRGLLGVLCLSALATGMSLAQPWITKLLIDDGLLGRNLPLLAWLCGAMVVLSLVSSVLGGVNQYFYTRLSAHILFSLRSSVYQHLQRLSPAFYARRSRGDLLSRVNGDVAEIQRFATDGVLASFNGVLALMGSLVILVSLSPLLSLFAFALLPLQVMYLRRMRPRIEKQTHVVRDHTGKLGDFFVSTLSAMKFIQASNAQGRESRRLEDLSEAYLGDLLRLNILNYVTSSVPGLLLVANTALIFLIGGYWVVSGEFTLGTLMAFTIYLSRATGPVQTLLGLYVASQRARVSLDRIGELMLAQPAVEEVASPKTLAANTPGAIVLQGVSFSYEGRHESVLSNVDLSIAAGSKVGVFGASGTGKSTLIDLLHRHWDPQQGFIAIDGTPLQELSLRNLRQRVAVVGQETVLFAGSIAENIAYASPDASRDRIEQVARAAQLHDWIDSLPQGYDSEVGEQGRLLSGGQRQRLSIARALLQNPRILILDEATAGVDLATEAAIIEEVDTLFGDCTRVVISHQAGPLRNADQLLRLRKGQFEPVDTSDEALFQ
jgi:ATP-binding cassette subfamily B protein